MQDPSKSVEDFFEDLADYQEAAPLLNMQPQSIPVAICLGRLPLTRYRRGRKTYLSKREIAELIQRRAQLAPTEAQPD